MKIFSPVLKGTTTVSDGTTNLSGSFTGSLQGTAATASLANTASYVVSSQTDATQNTRLQTLESTTGSFTLTSSFGAYTASNDVLNTTQNARLLSNEQKTGSFATTGSNSFYGNQSIIGSNLGIVFNPGSGGATIKQLSDNNIQTFIVDRQVTLAKQSGLEVTGSLLISGDVTATGTLTAQTLVVQTITSSVDFVSGSTRFGSTTGNTHKFTGSVLVSGSIGIGTESPASSFHTIGAIRSSNSGNTVSTRIESDGLYTAGSDMFIDGGTSNIRFYSTSERMRINSSGNVGIGTTNPVNRLHLYASNNAASIRLQNTAANKVWDLNPSDPDVSNTGFTIHNVTDNTKPFHIMDSGNVGIGTTNPGYKLEVSGNAAFSSYVYADAFAASGNNTISGWSTNIVRPIIEGREGNAISNYVGLPEMYYTSNAYYDGSNWIRKTANASMNMVLSGYNNNFLVQSAASGTAGAAVSFVSRFYINGSNGNVGIGTTSPGAKLEIRGNSESLILDVDSTGFDGRYALLPGRFVVGMMGNGYPEIGYNFRMTGNAYTKLGSDTAWGVDFGNSNLMRFKYASTGTGTFSFNTALAINTSGNIGIGTTSPSARLHLQGNAAYLNIQQTTTDGGILFTNENNTALWTIKHDFANGHLSFNNYNVSTPSLFLQHSTGRVGIGTTDPLTHLDVVSSTHTKLRVRTTGVADASIEILGYDAGLHIGDTTNGNRWVIWNDGISTSSSLKIGSYALGAWYADGSQAVTITSTGNVGIGLTTPAYRLHVQDSTTVGTVAIGHVSYPGLLYANASSGEFRIDNRSSAGSGYITFYPNGEASTVGNEAMRITPTRRVGIGTTNPTHALHVESSLRVNRTVYSWYKASWQGNGTYWHMKTNLYAGAAGNTQYTMSLFKAYMYAYSSAAIYEGAFGFHNWSGILYSAASAGNISFGGYISTDGYVVLVILSGSGESGVTIDWHQTYADYSFRESSVTAAGLHGSTTGKY